MLPQVGKPVSLLHCQTSQVNDSSVLRRHVKPSVIRGRYYLGKVTRLLEQPTLSDFLETILNKIICSRSTLSIIHDEEFGFSVLIANPH